MTEDQRAEALKEIISLSEELGLYSQTIPQEVSEALEAGRYYDVHYRAYPNRKRKRKRR